uniref:Uncharacterized protein n=1 Tax=Corvus moneduloides TaxID=1196302 RepID=A0A8C3DPD4_CORMO
FMCTVAFFLRTLLKIPVIHSIAQWPLWGFLSQNKLQHIHFKKEKNYVGILNVLSEIFTKCSKGLLTCICPWKADISVLQPLAFQQG